MTRKELFTYLLEDKYISEKLDQLDTLDGDNLLYVFKLHLRSAIEMTCKSKCANNLNAHRQSIDFILWLYNNDVDITEIKSDAEILKNMKSITGKAVYD